MSEARDREPRSNSRPEEIELQLTVAVRYRPPQTTGVRYAHLRIGPTEWTDDHTGECGEIYSPVGSPNMCISIRKGGGPEHLYIFDAASMLDAVQKDLGTRKGAEERS